MTEEEGKITNKSRGLTNLISDTSAASKFHKQMRQIDSLTGSNHAFVAALGPNSAFEKILRQHQSIVNATRVFPDVSAFAGIADITRITNAYLVPELEGIRAITQAHQGFLESFPIGSFTDMIATQSGLAALAQSLSVMENNAITQILKGVRIRQSVFESAIGAYMDKHRAHEERITNMVDALAIPRFDPARFGIGRAHALGETNVFKLAGMASGYASQFRFVTGAVDERISAFVGLESAAKAFALRPDLVGEIGCLLQQTLVEQEALLERQQQVADETADVQPRHQILIAERLTIIAAIATILQFLIFIALQIEGRMIGRDPATLSNTAAIEENTQTIDQMHGSLDALADQLEQMRVIQEEADQKDRIADEAIVEVLREIAHTLAEQEGNAEETP